MRISDWSSDVCSSDLAHPPVGRPGVGVLLVNLGTPDAPTPGAVKAYLREFLSDPRVVEIPPLIWQPILRGVILNTRPRKSAHAYSLVWDQIGRASCRERGCQYV